MHKKGEKYTFRVQSTFLGLTMQFRLTSRDMIEPRDSRVAQKIKSGIVRSHITIYTAYELRTYYYYITNKCTSHLYKIHDLYLYGWKRYILRSQ